MTLYPIVTRVRLAVAWRPLGRVRARTKVSCILCHLMSRDQVYKGSFTIIHILCYQSRVRGFQMLTVDNGGRGLAVDNRFRSGCRTGNGQISNYFPVATSSLI